MFDQQWHATRSLIEQPPVAESGHPVSHPDMDSTRCARTDLRCRCLRGATNQVSIFRASLPVAFSLRWPLYGFGYSSMANVLPQCLRASGESASRGRDRVRREVLRYRCLVISPAHAVPVVVLGRGGLILRLWAVGGLVLALVLFTLTAFKDQAGLTLTVINVIPWVRVLPLSYLC